MSQTFSQFCSNQRARIKSRSCFSAGKLDMAMNHNNAVENDVYDGPADLNQELLVEHRLGYGVRQYGVIGAKRALKA